MKVKLCGFTESQSLLCAIENGADFIGLVFVKDSPRNISFAKSKDLSALIPKKVKKVAVVVDPAIDQLEEILQNFAPDFWQFHGQESPEFLAEIRQKFPHQGIIKAIKVDESFDPSALKDYTNLVDYFLFDGTSPGSGNSFDWQWFAAKLQNSSKNADFIADRPWFLSGGLNNHNLAEAITITRAKFVDISSGIEEEKGKKSCRLIAELMKKINKI